MKLYDRNLSTPGTGVTQETHKLDRTGTKSSAAGSGASRDRVELSSTLGSISRAMSAYGSSRSSQVQSLATQYQSGSYRPDSAAISRGMVSEALSSGIK